MTRRRFLAHAVGGLVASGVMLSPFANKLHAATAPFTHDTSVLVAALHAPEPFRSHWRACRGGSWPDYMRDQPVGHANQRLAGLLYTVDAIRHLQSGNINKALLLASARCHYVGDSSCIAHAAAWKPRSKDDVLKRSEPGQRVWSFMPADVQDFWMPFDRESALGYDPILITPPPLFEKKWETLSKTGRPGHMHAFFDQTHALLPIPGRFPDHVHDFGKYLINEVGISDTENSSTYDREFYGRWVCEGSRSLPNPPPAPATNRAYDVNPKTRSEEASLLQRLLEILASMWHRVLGSEQGETSRSSLPPPGQGLATEFVLTNVELLSLDPRGIRQSARHTASGEESFCIVRGGEHEESMAICVADGGPLCRRVNHYKFVSTDRADIRFRNTS